MNFLKFLKHTKFGLSFYHVNHIPDNAFQQKSSVPLPEYYFDLWISQNVFFLDHINNGRFAVVLSVFTLKPCDFRAYS